MVAAAAGAGTSSMWWDEFGFRGGGGGSFGGGGAVGFNFADPSSRYGGFDSFGGGGMSAYSSFEGGGARSVVNTPMLGGGGGYQPHYNSSPVVPNSAAHSYASVIGSAPVTTKASPAQAANLPPIEVDANPTDVREGQWEASMDSWIQRNHLPPISEYASSQTYHDYYDIVDKHGSYSNGQLVNTADLRSELQTYADHDGNYNLVNDPERWQAAKNMETCGLLKTYGKIALAGGTLGAGASLAGFNYLTGGVLTNGASGAVAGYMDGGWRGAAVGGVAGLVTGAAAGPLGRVISGVGTKSVASMAVRTAGYSAVNAGGSALGAVASNYARGKDPFENVGKAAAIGALLPFMSGEAHLVGTGGELAYGKRVMDGFGAVTAGFGVAATSIDKESEHGFYPKPGAYPKNRKTTHEP